MKTELLDSFKYPFLNEIIQPHPPYVTITLKSMWKCIIFEYFRIEFHFQKDL